MSQTSTPFLRGLSLFIGWLADRRIPTTLRPFVLGTFARFTGADASEAALDAKGYSSVSAFFVRRLKEGARPLDADGRALVSPCDGKIQAVTKIERGVILQAKGRPYTVDEILGEPVPELEGGVAWTIYLGPRDYHRVHTPFDARLEHVRWLPGARYSVQPKVLAKRLKVLSINERAVLRLGTEFGHAYLVLVGALNVGRIRVVGVEHGTTPAAPLDRPRGSELGRFELGSTVVLLLPPGVATPIEGLVPETQVRLGRPIGRFEKASDGPSEETR
ncbi:MAG: archaetidylserine decarboxylase [Planctomycetota bacterium]